jgi:hypothetical protein
MVGATALSLLCVLGSLVLTAGATATAATPSATPAGGTPTAKVSSVSSYWLVARDGGIFTFGTPFLGSMGGQHLNQPIVGMAGTPDSLGYWLVASDGGIFTFGDASFYGSMGSQHLNKPIVGMASTPDGHGYWLVASDGGIFSFGDALFYGSMGAQHLNQPIVGMAGDPATGGYWLVASDGGIFSFGANFYGSTGDIHLNKPIVGMTASPDGGGYWFTASDGGVFSFGNAPFEGSLGNVPQSRPIVAMASDSDGEGYWMTNSNGSVSQFGDSTLWGSAPQVLNQPIVGMAEAAGNGSFAASPYPSGSFGYDISNFQCPAFPPSPHTIGVVQVVGASMAATNPCLGQEAAWAGGGLNLYMFLTNGSSASSLDSACLSSASDGACNYGFNAAVDAFTKAQAAGVNTSVAWWLDVETYSLPGIPSWSGDTAANAALVQGAIDGLHFEGLNGVGVYASPGVWSGIVGNYRPAVPYWAADWGINPATTCQNIHSQFPILPTGPVQLVQYSSPSTPTSFGGMNLAFDDDYAC